MRGWSSVSCLLLLCAVASTAAADRKVTDVQLSALQTAGSVYVEADAETRAAVLRATGMPMVSAVVEVCLTRKGAIRSVEVVRSSGLPGYDDTVRAAVRATWRFKPFRVGTKKRAKAIPVCGEALVLWTWEVSGPELGTSRP